MTYITTTQFLAVADNIAKSLVDIETDFISDPAAVAPTVATITAGQNAASSSLTSRVGALSVPTGTFAALPVAAPGVAGVVANYLSVLTNSLYAMWGPVLVALDLDLANTSEFLFANSLQVHPEFANAFNYVAANAQHLGLAQNPISPIEPAYIFPSATTSLGSVAVTGSSAGTFTAGSTLNAAKLGAAQLYIQNASVIAGGGTAPTVAAATATVANSSALGAGNWKVGYTWVSAAGESTISALGTVTGLTAGQYINVSSISFPTGATAIKFYVSTAAGGSTMGYSGVTLAAAAAVGIGDAGVASLPPPATNGAFIASAGTATSLTITYTNAAGIATATVTQALSTSLAASATLAAGSATGTAVSNIVVNSGGNSADTFNVVVVPLRSVTY